MNSATLANSDRLRRVMDVLADGQPHSTLEIIQRAGVVAVNSCAAELRDNGVEVNCWRDGGKWFYQSPQKGQRELFAGSPAETHAPAQLAAHSHRENT